MEAMHGSFKLSDAEIIEMCCSMELGGLLKRAKKSGLFTTARELQQIGNQLAERNLKLACLLWPEETFCLVAIPISLAIFSEQMVLAAYRHGIEYPNGTKLFFHFDKSLTVRENVGGGTSSQIVEHSLGGGVEEVNNEKK